MEVQVKNHSYQIVIEKGALQTAGKWAASLWKPQKIALITDENVAPLYAKEIEKQLAEQDFQVTTIVLPAGETTKSLSQSAAVYNQLAVYGFTRSDGIIALGGGVIGDLAGFVASTYMRGIHFLQIPTSLLAQVDSSIGGKTAVNTSHAKNLVGTFYQPDGVLIDPEVLNTLPDRRLREGIAEIIKSAAIADEQLWQILQQLQDEYDLLRHAEKVIEASLKIKRKMVEEDEFDHGSRLQLNFGHTIGHALEKNADYQTISHGEGVAIGMVMISRAAEKKKQSPEGITLELIELLKKYHLPTTIADLQLGLDNEQLFQAITHDKKTRGSKMSIILLEKIGQAKIITLPVIEMKEYLEEE